MRLDLSDILRELVRTWFIIRFSIYAICSLIIAIGSIGHLPLSMQWLFYHAFLPIVVASLSISAAILVKRKIDREKYIGIPVALFEILTIGSIFLYSIYEANSSINGFGFFALFTFFIISVNLTYILFHLSSEGFNPSLERFRDFTPKEYYYITNEPSFSFEMYVEEEEKRL